MFILENRQLRLELLDPAADTAHQGWRYCWGGYIWQVHDRELGPLLSGPEFPRPHPLAFNGQGLPESFRHRTRAGRPLTWRDGEGLAIGVGTITANPHPQAPAPESVLLGEPCHWEVAVFPTRLVCQTRQAAAGFSYELTRRIELDDRTVTSRSQLTNTGHTSLGLQWFAHPFWPLIAGSARLQLPVGTVLLENPGFAVAADGLLTFRHPFESPEDSQFALLTLPAGCLLSVSLNHPKLSRVTFATSFVPDECPVWANQNTISVEPYLHLDLAPGATRHWHVCHGFER